ncbi:MAG: hypothetical protein RL112_2730, partial [Planctomycetota bacterium]|jgi:hypothetical protein
MMRDIGVEDDRHPFHAEHHHAPRRKSARKPAKRRK